MSLLAAGARPGPSSLLRHLPAPVLVVVSIVGIQTGQAWSKQLFEQTGPMSVVTMRLGFAALVLVVLLRPRLPTGPRAAGQVIAFGSAIAGMSMLINPALQRLPVGVAVTLQFLGPLTVALTGSRRRTDLVWIALAGLGVYLFADPGGGGWTHSGAGFALASGGCWAAYILLTKRVGAPATGAGVDSGGSRLALAVLWAALVSAPFGFAETGPDLVALPVLLAGFGVAVVSAAIPYSLDLAALRRLSSGAFGVLGSLEPAAAAAAGLLILGEHLAPSDWLAVACVAAASVGVTATAGTDRTR